MGSQAADGGGFPYAQPVAGADQLTDDPTITRCMSRSIAGKYDQLEVANLFPLRATNAAFTLTVAGSALGAFHFRGRIYVYFCYGPMTRAFPKEMPVDRLQGLGFPPPCYPGYPAPDSYPCRTDSC